MNNDHVHSAIAKLKTANNNFASFLAKPPNKIPANISGYTVLLYIAGVAREKLQGTQKLGAIAYLATAGWYTRK